jgi:1-acyl-sn-glycerol-3-phosphate acyltransferase
VFVPLAKRAVNGTVDLLTGLLCRVEAEGLEKVPERGPLLLVANHINFLEIPVLRKYLDPRPMAGLAKAESWDNPLVGYLFTLWGGIPIRRGETDLAGMRRALAALREGYILAIGPEGTRSHDGRLGPGHPGVVALALQSKAPLLPVAHFGGELVGRNVRRLRRTRVRIVVGDPFTLDAGEARATRDVREEMTDQVMYQLAALLPPAYRGVYSDLTKAKETYLRFAPPHASNLWRAMGENLVGASPG